jgi:hypothetical protein
MVLAGERDDALAMSHVEAVRHDNQAAIRLTGQSLDSAFDLGIVVNLGIRAFAKELVELSPDIIVGYATPSVVAVNVTACPTVIDSEIAAINPPQLREPFSRNTAISRWASGSLSDRLTSIATRRVPTVCCARAATGQLVITPMSVINSRRRIRCPRLKDA